ncbi:MAG: 3'(2'),5'-bisphosphate nucleotidase CysQ [Paracoccaceae bacterium]|nr:3'(2'),5'-bisphosphate nucleotidase CysQ [Paracoccaceae bacterium]
MPASDLALLVDAAEVAGRIAARYWRLKPRQWDKGEGAGPVTEADLAIDRMLRDRLTKARPGYGWLSEETEDDPARLSAERAFIVDPIDGTRAFIAGEKGFSHALAVVEAGRVTAAVVYLPMAEKLYTAAQGGGARLNGQRIRASQRDRLDGASVVASSHALSPQHWPHGAPEVHRHFRASLAHRLCLVADGSFDATLTFRPAWEWDVAAGALIAAEAGALTTGAHGEALAFNAPRPLAPGLLVAPPILHEAFLAKLGV